ncbi:MAG TPA: DUF4384 domain-containing protein [Nitrospiraceae bacterium]|nr:DUF4384 domain-containing protein [Nitrospiraceae bacterium]
MTYSSRFCSSGRGRRRSLPAFLSFLLLSSCAAAPFLIPAGIEFARNLLVTSNKNYGGKYSEDMNRLMIRLSTPYVAMGLPMGTSPAALVPPTMLMQQQQAMLNAQATGQPGMGMGMGYPDPYNPAGGMMGGYGMQGYGGMGGYGGMSAYGGMSGYGASQYGYQGQMGGYYDPNNPYASVPGMNVQAPAYGMTQPYGGQYGSQPYGGQMGGMPPQPGYPAQGLPPQPGYPAAAPGMASPTPAPGYGQASMGYGQQPMQQGMYQQPMQQGMYQQPMDPYQQQAVQGYQQQPMQQNLGGAYQQPAMQGYQQPMQGYAQPGMAPGYGQSPNNMGVSYQSGIVPRGIPGPADQVTLDVALIRQVSTSNGKQVALMQDGETLKGGADGDRFKLVVRTNCECFVYVISIDGSGWAQPVFPLANGTVTNPFKPEVEQSFPDGPYWFTLDQFKGVETFFLVASPARRTDLEESLTELAGQQRPVTHANAQVEEPAVIPNGFGKIQAGQATQVRDEAQQPVQVTPLSYVAAKAGEDVRVTRWFKHQ